MKILQISNLLAPVHGGSAKVIYQLSRELVKRKHDVNIYSSDFKISREYLTQETGLRIYAFKTWLCLAGFQITPDIVVSIRNNVKNFDIIHMHNYRTFQNSVVYNYALKAGIPYILQAHGSIATFFYKGWLKRAFDTLWGHRILKDASKLIAVSEIEAEHYKSMGISEDRIEIVHNGVDLAEFTELPARGEFRRRYNIHNDQQIILYIGRIHKIKGLDLLIETFSDISKRFIDTILVIVGPDDGYLPHLKKSILNLGIGDRVLATGSLYGGAKLSAYVDADIFVLPSFYEIFGITVIEALACGTPVIVTKQCGIAEAINDKVGLVVPYNQDSLGKAVMDILSDDKKRRELGEKGKLLIREKFNSEEMAERVDSIYQNVINNG